MSLIYVDGFDTYDTALIYRRWPIGNASYTGWSVAGSSRNGNGLSLSAPSSRFIGRTLGGQYTTVPVIVGFGFMLTGYPTANNAMIIGIGKASGTQNISNTCNCALAINSSGYLLIGKVANGTFTTLATYSTALATNTWMYIEFKTIVKSSTTAGDIKVAIDGTTIYSDSGGLVVNSEDYVDTLILGQCTPNATMNSQTFYYDDLYILDGNGSVNNDFLGDMQVSTIFPSSNGSQNDFTPLSGSNYSCVSETSSDEDTSYISGDKDDAPLTDLYTLQSFNLNPVSIAGIQNNSIVRRDQLTTMLMSNVIRVSSTNYDATNSQRLSLSYEDKFDIWEQDPSTSSAWTSTSINSMEAGIKLVS